MTGEWGVAVIGFSTFERQTLDSYFRMAAQHELHSPVPRFAVTHDLSLARWLLLDADQPALIQGVVECGRLRDCLLIGGPAAPAGAAGWLPRPVDALQVTRTLAEMHQRRAQHDLDQFMTGRHLRTSGPCARARQQAAQQRGAQPFGSVEGYSNAVIAASDFHLADVLIISDDDFEWRPLQATLSRLGYTVKHAHTSQGGLSIACQKPWQFVFLGSRLDSPSPFEACRVIKAGPHPSQAMPPVVVMLSPTGSALDRVRSMFAGADASLPTNSQGPDLMALLSRHDNAFERVFEPTAPMAL